MCLRGALEALLYISRRAPKWNNGWSCKILGPASPPASFRVKYTRSFSGLDCNWNPLRNISRRLQTLIYMRFWLEACFVNLLGETFSAKFRPAPFPKLQAFSNFSRMRLSSSLGLKGFNKFQWSSPSPPQQPPGQCDGASSRGYSACGMWPWDIKPTDALGGYLSRPFKVEPFVLTKIILNQLFTVHILYSVLCNYSCSMSSFVIKNVAWKIWHHSYVAEKYDYRFTKCPRPWYHETNKRQCVNIGTGHNIHVCM